MTMDKTKPHTIKTTPEKLASTSSYIQRIFHAVIPLVFWPIQWTTTFYKEKLKISRFTNDDKDRIAHYLPARIVVFNIVGAYAVLLTFGVAYPPLAVIIAISIEAFAAIWKVILQKHIDDIYSIPNNLVNIVIFRNRLEHDCRKLWKVFTKSLSLLLLSCSFFYGLYFVDTVQGNRTASIIAIGVPFTWHVGKFCLKIINKDAYRAIGNQWLLLTSKFSSTGTVQKKESPKEIMLTRIGSSANVDSDSRSSNSNTDTNDMLSAQQHGGNGINKSISDNKSHHHNNVAANDDVVNVMHISSDNGNNLSNN